MIVFLSIRDNTYRHSSKLRQHRFDTAAFLFYRNNKKSLCEWWKTYIRNFISVVWIDAGKVRNKIILNCYENCIREISMLSTFTASRHIKFMKSAMKKVSHFLNTYCPLYLRYNFIRNHNVFISTALFSIDLNKLNTIPNSFCLIQSLHFWWIN